METAIIQPRKTLPLSTPVLLNMLICGVIGAAFGIPSRNIPAWLAGGLLFGLLMGLATDAIFSRVRHRPRIYRRRLTILVLLETLVTMFIFVPAYAAYFSAHPIRYPISVTPAEMGIDYEDVAIHTADGITLTGWYIPSKNGAAIIALHGYNGNRTHVIYHAQALAQQGYGVLALDMRAHGESSGTRSTGGWEGIIDIPAAVSFLQSRPDVDPQRIGALGLSAGANTIINGTAQNESIKAIIADGLGSNGVGDMLDPVPPQMQPVWALMNPLFQMYDWMMGILSEVPAQPPFKALIPQIAPRPILFISAGRDIEQFLNREYYEIAGETAQLWELPDDGHTGGFLAHPQEYTERMVTFFDSALLAK